MKIVMCAVNANFYHSSLSLLSLKRTVPEALLLEHNINQPVSDIVYDIYSNSPDVLCLSCYIFNIEYIRKIISAVRKILPDIIIIGGGIEITYDTNHTGFDYIIRGAGDLSFRNLLNKLIESTMPHHPERTIVIDGAEVSDLDSLPFPYDDGYLEKNRNKLIYYESARGCPFKCSYCNSSVSNTITCLPLERVYSEIDFFVRHNVKTVKFIDRTFNYDIKRANAIWKYISGINNYEGVFHFECKGEFFDEESIEILNNLPPSRVQLEIGIQSVNEPTLNAVCRKSDLNRATVNIRRLLFTDNIHIHLDLIAGLPGEDYNTFANGFDYVYGLKPNHIQLGILKMLKGTGMRDHDGYIYSDYPPYEALVTPDLNYAELSKLKILAQLTDKFYNPGRMKKAVDYLLGIEKSAFALLEKIYKSADLNDTRAESPYTALQDIRPGDKLLNRLLIYDYMRSNSSKIPQRMITDGFEINIIHRAADNKRLCMFDYDLETMQPGKSGYIFDYNNKDASGLYKVTRVN